MEPRMNADGLRTEDGRRRMAKGLNRERREPREPRYLTTEHTENTESREEFVNPVTPDSDPGRKSSIIHNQ